MKSAAIVACHLSILCLGLRWSECVRAEVLEVDLSGAAEFDQLQDALNAAAPGDTVLLHPGRYDTSEEHFLGALSEGTYAAIYVSNLTVRGMERDSVVIGPESYTWTSVSEPNGFAMVLGVNSLRIENLTVENVVHGAELGGSAVVSNIKFRGCYRGIISWASGALVVSDSYFADCIGDGYRCNGSSGGTVLERCIFQGPGGGFTAANSMDVAVRDCEFTLGSGVEFESGSSGSIVRTNIGQGGSLVVKSSTVDVSDVTLVGGAVATIELAQSELAGRQIFVGSSSEVSVLARGQTELTIEESVIENSELASVMVNHYSVPGYVLDLRNNWWGTTDETLIEEWILDSTDEPDRGALVLWQPILHESVPTLRSSMGSLKGLFKAQIAPEAAQGSEH